jgi:hypothetical protein
MSEIDYTVISRDLFDLIGQDLGYPEVMTGDIRLEAGAQSWARTKLRLIPSARQTIARELVGGPAPWPLFQAEASRVRLRAHRDAGSPTLSRNQLKAGLTILGLEHLRPMITTVVRKAPAPIQWHIVNNVWITGVGLEDDGWCSPTTPAPAGLQLVNVNGRLPASELIGVLAHEAIGHAFTLPFPKPPSEPWPLREPINPRKRQLKLVREWGRQDILIDPILALERQAVQLIAALGFEGPAADVRQCVTLTRLAALRRL